MPGTKQQELRPSELRQAEHAIPMGYKLCRVKIFGKDNHRYDLIY